MILFLLFATGVIDTAGKFAANVVDTSGNLPPVSLTPAANLLPVSLSPVTVFYWYNNTSGTSGKSV
jgi:hypothetical protein